MGVAERLTEHCKAKDFAQRLDKEVFAGVPAKPGADRLDQAKLQVQALYQEYRKVNQCQGTFVAGHRCLVDIYNEALDRLYAIEPRVVQPRRSRKVVASPPLPPLPAEDRAATILGEINDTFTR